MKHLLFCFLIFTCYINLSFSQTITPGSVSPTYQWTNNYTGAPQTLVATLPSGAACNGSALCYTYQWQSSANGTSGWANVSGATGLSYNPGNYLPTTTTYYRLRVSSSGLADVYTNTAQVVVENSVISGPVDCWVGQSVTYYYTGGFGNYTWGVDGGTTSLSYTGGNYALKWITAGTYQINVNINGTYYYLHVYVHQIPINPGDIGKPVQNIESGSTITLSTYPYAATGGTCTGNFTYQWESSSDGITFNPVGGGAGLTVDVTPIQTSTFYRRKVTCGSAYYSDTTNVVLYPYFDPGTITAGNIDSIAWGSVPANISGTTPSGGFKNGYDYEWEFSTDNSVFYPVSAVSQGTGFQPDNLYTTTWYRRKVTNGGVTRYTNSAQVKVKISHFNPGTITPYTLVINSGASPSLTGTAGTGGTTGTYSYQWQQSYDETSWKNAIGTSNTQNYSPGALTKTTYYRRIVTNGGQSDFSAAGASFNQIKIKVVQGLGAVNIPTATIKATADPSISAVPINPYSLTAITPAKVNYVRTWDLQKPAVTTVADVKALYSMNDFDQVTSYTDDMGREIQTVAKKVTPYLKDLVTVINYDLLGRKVQEYLPYTDNTSSGDLKTDASSQQPAYYNTIYNAQEGFYYTNTKYESSPKNRLLKTTAPGNSWTGSNIGVRKDYTFNTSLDSVRIWTIATASTSAPATSTTYAPGSLAVVITTDEQENKTIEYKDKEGKIILKKVQLNDTLTNGPRGWLCTYYVYDVFNRLRYVLPPKAIEYALANSWSLSTTVKDEFCFRYFYDAEGRMVVKKIPGAGEMWMVYDVRDRLVMAQDSSYRAAGKWLYTQYDSLNRTAVNGSWVTTGDRSYHQNLAATSISYPSPGSGNTVLTQTYYDDYSWVSGSGSGLASTFINSVTSAPGTYLTAEDNSSSPYPRALIGNNSVEGFVTGTKTNVLGTSSYLYSVNFYDDKGRIIQVHSTNYSGGKDTLTTQYSFNGLPLNIVMGHGKGGTNAQQYRVQTSNSYDAAGRLNVIIKQIGNSPAKILVSNAFDDLGRTDVKYLGSQFSFLDTLNYSYNIRGWLKSINKDYARNENSAVNWFGEEISYDYGFTRNAVNSNIGGIKWRTKDDGEQRAYGFAYDVADRLTTANFTQYTNSAWGTTAGIDFTVPTINYDANGNLTKMTQKGLVLNTSQFIDSLNYGYNANSNKLSYVTDLANNTTSVLGDFKEINNNTTQDYWYDGNGNLIQDANKNISSITYNHLDLPSTVTITGKGTTTFTYDASGHKLKKTTVDNTVTPARTTVTDYIGLFVYQNDTLQFIGQEEGRIRLKTINRTDTIYYDYFERDHLGNTRVVLTDEKQQDTYPAATLENNLNAYNTEKAYYSINNADTISVSRIASWNSTTGNNYANNNGNPPYNNNPYANTSATSAIVYKLNGATGDKTGLGITLKVMTGDVIDIFGKSFWHSNGVNPTNNYLITSALSTFITAFAGTSAVAGSGHGATASALNGSSATTTGLNNWLNGVPNPSQVSVPKAYINWILFDEQFKPVASNSNYDIISTTSDAVKNHHSTVNISKSGYLYVYCSNESNIDVFFDNLQLIHTRGPLLETTHYYPFGLTMAGISSRAAGKIENKFRYNGKEQQNKEFSDGSGLDTYDYGARMYDAQIGRFNTIDPHAENYLSYTPYHYVFDNPVNSTDPTGMDTHLEGQAAVEAFTAIQNINRSNQSGETDIRLDGDKADALARASMDIYGGSGGNNFEIKAVLPVWEAITPDIYRHDKDAIAEHGQILSKGPKGINKTNRKLATDWYIRMFTRPPLTSADEYPFAFTNEGGTGASVRWVPVWEQDIQRFQLALLSMALQVNDHFIVVPISEKDGPGIINTPFFWLLPNGEWKKNHNTIDRRNYDPAYKQLGKKLEKPAPENDPKTMPPMLRNALIGLAIATYIILTDGWGVVALE